jgi:hypothetical protein
MEKNTTPLSTFEHTLLWMAIRYAMNRQTIASATLPADIITNYYHRLTTAQKLSIVQDLERNENDLKGEAFGNRSIDRPHWIKFMKCLDEKCHYKIKTVDGEEIIVFEANDKYISLEKYIHHPHQNWYIPEENIALFNQ